MDKMVETHRVHYKIRYVDAMRARARSEVTLLTEKVIRKIGKRRHYMTFNIREGPSPTLGRIQFIS